MQARDGNYEDDLNGFTEWGGYMEAKRAKLLEQFREDVGNLHYHTNIFKGIAIFVNGYTDPPAERLKELIACNGGFYHTYQVPVSAPGPTTHIIASNLPVAKIKAYGSVPVVKPEWITQSIEENNLLDYRKFLLHPNIDGKQLRLDFPVTTRPLEELARRNWEQKPQLSRALTAADPGFLTEFYNNSRLHLISTLGAEYKQLVSELRQKSDSTFPGREKLKQLNGTACVGNTPVVMHIDMDCFFVSVGVRDRPDLQGQPVAVTHARGSRNPVSRSALERFQPDYVEELPPLMSHDSFHSLAEVASCSYEARAYGVRNGLFLGLAQQLCPDLMTIPYNFEEYKKISNILYQTIASYTLDIEAVSCDEMYVDVEPLLHEACITVDEWATHIRKEIYEATGCPCSTGFGGNRLQARLATRKAKPNGQYYLQEHEVEEHMPTVYLVDLPGVGEAIFLKLKSLGLMTCGDLMAFPLPRLQAELGKKFGQSLYEQAQGIDRKPLNYKHERKSVSVEVNYGIRFKNKEEALHFLFQLSNEVYNRLQNTGMRAQGLTLKLLVRAPDAPEITPKFLGCGDCNAITRSTRTPRILCTTCDIYRDASNMFNNIKVSPTDLRGMAIQLTRLEKVPPENPVLTTFLQQPKDPKDVSAEVERKVDGGKPKNSNVKASPSKKQTNSLKSGRRGRPKGSSNSKLAKKSTTNDLNRYFKPQVPLQPNNLNDIDLDVLNELPEDIRQEIAREYRLEPKTVSVLRPQSSSIKDDAVPVPQCKPPTATQQSVFHSMDWEDLKPVILNWLSSETEPASVDIAMLADYFKQLAIDRKIESLKKMLSFLHRHVAKVGSCAWHEAYWTIINTMQEGMVACYGSTLLVERGFVCAVHA